MLNDPIVDEVHRIRESLAERFSFDVKAIFADMRAREAVLGNRLVIPGAISDKHRDRSHIAPEPSQSP
jgi:hypothetical protein